MQAHPVFSLDDMEAQLQQLQAALLSQDPQALQQGALALRQTAATLAQTASAGQALDASAAVRVRALAGQLPALRDQLARVLAFTDRQAKNLLPPQDNVTYGPSGGLSAARIYRAPG